MIYGSRHIAYSVIETNRAKNPTTIYKSYSTGSRTPDTARYDLVYIFEDPQHLLTMDIFRIAHPETAESRIESLDHTEDGHMLSQ